MKINLKVTVLIAALGLFAVSAYAQQGGSQSDPGMQQEGTVQQQQTEQKSSDLQSRETAREVQQALNNQGYSAGPADGKWGSKSTQALKKFQQAKGMEPTGQISEEVLLALGIAPAEGAGAGAGGQQGDMSEQQGGPAPQQEGSKY